MYLSSLYAPARTFLGKFVENEQGVTAIEYAIIIATATAIVSLIFSSSGPIKSMFTQIFSTLASAI